MGAYPGLYGRHILPISTYELVEIMMATVDSQALSSGCHLELVEMQQRAVQMIVQSIEQLAMPLK